MPSEKHPSDFDWVTARDGCVASKVFEQLYLEARKNIEKANALSGSGAAWELASTNGSFSVSRMVFGSVFGVRFYLAQDEITVEGTGVNVQFTATLTLNDDGECRLLVDGSELDRWQVLRRALEPLFFGRFRR